MTSIDPSDGTTPAAPGGENRSLLAGPIVPALVRLAAPVTLAMAVHLVFSIVDLVWVGRLGAAATGAVSVCFYASWSLFGIGESIGVGIVAQVSRAMGASRADVAGHVSAQGVLLSIVTGLALAILGPWLAPLLFAALGTPDEVTMLGVSYLRIFLFGGPVVMAMVALESIWRAAGDTVTPMWVMGGSTVVNLVLDPLLIFGVGPFPELGVAGAAWASVVSWIFAVVVFVVLARRGSERFPFRRLSMRALDWAVCRNTVRIGLPHLLIGTLFSGVYLFLSAVTARLGVAAIAVLGIANRVESIVYLVSEGVGMGVATMVGQNLGAHQPERAEHATNVGAVLGMSLTLIPTAAMLLAPATLMSIFTSDPEVIELGTRYMWILGLCQVFMAIEIVFAQGFAGAGDTVPPMLVELPISGSRIPLAWLVALHWGLGLNSIAWVITLTSVARGVWMWLWFRTGRWKRRTWQGAAE